MNLEITQADYGGWVTGAPTRWIPKPASEIGQEPADPLVQRAIIEAVYDAPGEGIYYVQLVGEAAPGPNGETEAGGAFATCTPGNGTACYTGGFSLDLRSSHPGAPRRSRSPAPSACRSMTAR